MSGPWFVVKEVNYPPLKIIVTGNDETVILPPDRAEFNQLVSRHVTRTLHFHF
jgi:hypothetical protein